ncbi:MAG: 2-isopropylmalate synthase [Acidaminococcaceae bacterium]|jgi:2-isopropylmalate synthase|nr:2-isopropylmalate synthase [Acidaminococcaceae bacterium]
MHQPVKKYLPFMGVKLPDRQWPNKKITAPPIWCSVDLRDGNQALVTPMQLEEKLLLFKTLVDIGFKEIEVGFPSASETEYEILRTLIEKNYIPDDVTIQVLVQARPKLIKKTFEAVQGAKNVIIHFYNSTSALQRKIVFNKGKDGITAIAVEGAKLIKQLTEEEVAKSGMHIRYEYSPESFTGTEMDYAIEICDAVLDALGATKENPVILNLPSTVEMSTPNTYADQIEYCCRALKKDGRSIISIHPHNDRGTGVAATELAIMAGADRVEGTLFGNGERTGNVDIVNVALNMYTHNVDPKLDFSHINHIKDVCEQVTKMPIDDRHPYAGKLVFTAFSGSHQDAVRKGLAYMADTNTPYWEVPYLPINPADINREYEPVIRINSQSGKGGAAFVMEQTVGYRLPKAMQVEFGKVVKDAADNYGDELSSTKIVSIFNKEYVDYKGIYALKKHKISEEQPDHEGGEARTTFEGNVEVRGKDTYITGHGNGPIDAFFNALQTIGVKGYEFIDYHEHAISQGSNSKAIAYIELKRPDGEHVFGVGINPNINTTSLLGVVNAMNRSLKNA